MTRLRWRQDRAAHLPPALPTKEAEERLLYERAQAEQAWHQARQATDPREARRWLERAFAFTPSDQNLAFALATSRLAAGDADEARRLFLRIASRHPTREVLAGVAAACLALGLREEAGQAVDRALASAAPTPALLALGQAAHGSGWRAPEADPAVLDRVEGFVSATEGGITGWAWHPADPDRDPVLRIIGPGPPRTIVATGLSGGAQLNVPLARPRAFHAGLDGGPVRVMGPDGRDLWGSPLGGTAPPAAAPPPRPDLGVAVIVPVYRGHADTMACLASVLATLPAGARLIVVNDGSPDPALTADLAALARAEPLLSLIASCPADPTRNLGFPAAANAGIRQAGGADIVLLNSDTLVFPGWLTLLRDAAYSAAGIGTATPLSNDATIFTAPDPANPSPMPNAAEGARLAATARRVNAGRLVDVPTGHGFCLFIRAECLHATGLLDEARFAQGYGEENDFCERAAALGWRHVAVPSVFVAHRGGVSFGAAKSHLLRRNAAILDRLHPDYHARVQDFIARDPLAPARARLDRAAFAEGATAPAILLVTHSGGGGTARVVRARCEAAQRAGQRPVVLSGAGGATGVADSEGGTPNLRFTLPGDRAALLRLLRSARPARAEIHHLLGHGAEIGAVIQALAIPIDVWIHDWQWLCARISLLTGEWRFCGEPPASVCDACVAEWGDAQETPLPPAAIRARAATLLGAAERVFAPSADAARRILRHFPEARVEIQAWEPDPPRLPPKPPPPADGPLVVAVAGAISQEKGYGMLLACARDARARDLPLRFAIVGYTVDDTPLLETGHAFVTGPFRGGEAAVLLARTGARLGFLPSIWPETWCYALSDLWGAGLDAAVFDIGTPAERVRRTGRGWVMPLGLPPARVNDALLNLQGLAGSPEPIARPVARVFQERDDPP